jgi:ribosomal protein S18 acetylase RimI-like enzyme
VSCAIELLEAALARAEGNTYEALVITGEEDEQEEEQEQGGDGPGHPRLLGYVCFGATPMTQATFDLYWIIVAAEARGRGVGRQLLEATERHLAARGARILRVETSSLEGEGGAARFYDRAHYVRSGVIAGFYRPGDDLITFTKTLA